jgi:hypothetical protein
MGGTPAACFYADRAAGEGILEFIEPIVCKAVLG